MMGSTKIECEKQSIAVSSGYYPSISLTEKAVPQLARKKIGDVVKITITGKIKSARADDSESRYEIEVTDAKAAGGESDMKDEDAKKTAAFLKRKR